MFSCIPESNKVSKSESLGLRVENNSSVPKLFISLSLINCINPRIKNCLLKSNRIYHLTDPWRLKGELRAHIVGWNISQGPKWWTISARLGGNLVIFISFLPHLLCISYLSIIFVYILHLQTSRKTKCNRIRIQLDWDIFFL